MVGLANCDLQHTVRRSRRAIDAKINSTKKLIISAFLFRNHTINLCIAGGTTEER